MISASINVNKIDKSKLFEGKKGKYLNLILIETPDSEYGDYMVKQDQTKEEREAGNQTEILGNAKILSKGSGKPSKRSEPDEDEIPF